MLLRNLLIERSNHADQLIEYLTATRQHHRQPCEEQPRVDAAGSA